MNRVDRKYALWAERETDELECCFRLHFDDGLEAIQVAQDLKDAGYDVTGYVNRDRFKPGETTAFDEYDRDR